MIKIIGKTAPLNTKIKVFYNFISYYELKVYINRKQLALS